MMAGEGLVSGVFFIIQTPYFLSFVVTTLTFMLLVIKRNRDSFPPCYSGWIPWLGCAIEFGKAPLCFIDESRRKLGPLFTLKVAGKRLTFITDPQDFTHFFQSSNVDFQKVVQQPVAKTGEITAEGFFKNHTKIHDTVKGRLAPKCLAQFCSSLSQNFSDNIKSWGQKGEGDLNDLVRSSMYKAVLNNLFGENVLPTSPEESFKELEAHFVKFDDEFEYGSQLPALPGILTEWRASKKYLLDLFKQIVPKVIKQDVPASQESLLQTLSKNIEGPYAANFGLLMMWASLANAIPITFWTLAFIYSHPEEMKKIMDEVTAVMGKKDKSKLEVTESDLQKMQSIKRAMLEAIRLRSPGVITRGVIKTFKIRGYTIPEGDHLMLSPYWSHRNTKLFPDPERFNPDRWLKADLEKNFFLEGFVAFGGGRYQCPGRWFALMEIQVYIALVLHLADVTLTGPLPKHSTLHIVGTQQPEGPCNIKFMMKN